MTEYQFVARLYDPLLNAGLYKIRERVVALARRKQVQSVVDVCCGTGNQLKYLKKQGFSELSGVDISEAMLSQVNKGNYQVNCLKEDASRMSFSDNQFDMGIISFALHEKPREVAEAILNDTLRVIRPGGWLLLVDYQFDQQTRRSGKVIIHTVERLAGREHYRYFRKYLRYGGMDALINGQANWQDDYRFHRGATQMRLYQLPA